MKNNLKDLDLIESLIDKGKGQGWCWKWLGDKHPVYNKPWLKRKKKVIWPHLKLFEAKKHKIPPEGTLWRLCSTKNCMNPDHLRVVLPRDPNPIKISMNDLRDGQPSSHKTKIRPYKARLKQRNDLFKYGAHGKVKNITAEFKRLMHKD